MTEKCKARRAGHPDTEITLEEYWALPEPEQSETSILRGGTWSRPNRFISDGSDIRSEPSAEQLAARAAAKK